MKKNSFSGSVFLWLCFIKKYFFYPISLAYKKFVVHLLLTVLGFVVILKQKSPFWWHTVIKPAQRVFRFFGIVFGVPFYRLFFWIRRSFFYVYLPTKQHLLYMFSNRFTSHVVMGSILFATLFFQVFQGTSVRAESFGQKSLLYQLVAEDTLDVVEEISAKQDQLVLSPYYENTYTLFADQGIDFHSLQDAYVSTTTGTSSVVEEESSSVSARSETIFYTIEQGDTLIAIARTYGLSLSTILWSNNLSATSTIRPGQEIKILPMDGVLYKVKNGDTLSRIVSIYKSDVFEILSVNKLADANSLKIGQELMLPGGEAPAPATERRSTSLARIFTPPSSNTNISSSASQDWVWPTDWTTITQYFGWNHTGLDIDGNYQTNNYAAHAGVVTYTGWKGGYGLAVEMDHGNGIKTRYGHFSSISVSQGDVLSAGDILGKTGTTGRSTGTHLHFEIIINGNFRNPLDYIR